MNMTTVLDFRYGTQSRRAFLRGVAQVGGAGFITAATLAAPAGAAAKKLPQKAAAYQPTPKGKQRCDNCAQWQSPAACKIVDGAIAPSGWCDLYGPKG
jgi:hypothetical protein